MKLQSAKIGAERPVASGLSELGAVELSPDRQQLLELAEVASGGTAAWRGRKHAEGRDLFALSQFAPPGRLRVEHLDLSVDLRAVVRLRVPVPCMRPAGGKLDIVPQALLGITYAQEMLHKPLPGFAFVQIMAPPPGSVWHANVAADTPAQPLCLGASLPVGIQVKELVLMAYGALSMQTVMIDELDAAGVMNPGAARWWQQNRTRIPLSDVPFLSPGDAKMAADGAAFGTGGDGGP